MRKIVLSNEEIQKICKRIGEQLSTRYRFNELPPIIIGVMKGAIPFLVDLVNNMDIPLLIDYIQIGSYNGTESTGTVIIKKDVSLDIQNRDIVIVEDIIDSGISMNFLIDYFNKKYSPKSIITVSLLDKKCNRKIRFDVDYAGFEVENYFLLGYGLDYNDLGRNTNYVFIPDKEEIAEWDRINALSNKK
ncbi:MAG: hypoxanthine phosphoribosyltransferase [Bacillales bacterium]|nr:hypoxanthine phosphoribosyltransferase [Bacillales bacterium]